MATKKATTTTKFRNQEAMDLASGLNKGGAHTSRRVLGVADFLTRPALVTLEIPELVDAEGNIGLVYLKPPTAGIVYETIVIGGDQKPTWDSLREMVAYCVTDAAGTPIFDIAQLDVMREMRLDVFNRISAAVMGLLNLSTGAVGKGQSTSSGDDSSTDSPSS